MNNATETIKLVQLLDAFVKRLIDMTLMLLYR
jgi:hypothetical protein